MYLMLAIGIPVFLIFGGALLAFAFSSGEPAQLQPTAERVAAETSKAHPLVFFQPVGWSSRMNEATIEEVVASIERHLRQEQQVAASFARDPSSPSLFID